LAQITVSVREILPNGDLVIAGEQMVEINPKSNRSSWMERFARET